eukprot:COSAG03_NODE_8526_length_795_cov_1.043103_2_plen_73_part_01
MLGKEATGDKSEGVSLADFLTWFNHSEYLTSWLDLQSDTDDMVPMDISFPAQGAGVFAQVVWVIMLPLNAAMV